MKRTERNGFDALLHPDSLNSTGRQEETPETALFALQSGAERVSA